VGFPKKQKFVFNLESNTTLTLKMKDGAGSRLLPLGQLAFSRHALVGYFAEQPARRLAGVVREHLEVVSGGKPLARLPQADGGNGEAQIGGNPLEWDLLPDPPAFERERKAGANVTVG
jgi:hypothetical protein